MTSLLPYSCMIDPSCHFSLGQSSPESSSFSADREVNLSAGGNQHGPTDMRGMMLSYTPWGPGLIKPPPQTWFSFSFLSIRCLRNVMISVTFTVLEEEDCPHHLIFPQRYYNVMLCFFKILWANALSMWQTKASRHLILGMERSQGSVGRNSVVRRLGSKQRDQLVCQSHELAFSGANTSLAASLLTLCRLCRWENTFLCAYRFLLPCHANTSAGAWGCCRGMQLSSDSLITPAANALSGLGDKSSVLYDFRSQKCFFSSGFHGILM